MMDQIASLMARGLISPDAAQGMVQRVADLKNQRPFESGGGAPTNSVYVPRGAGEQIKQEPTQPEAAPKEPWKPDTDAGLNAMSLANRFRRAYKDAMRKLSPEEHLGNLKSAGADEAKFKDAFEQLSNDKSVKADDLKQIVKDYDAGVVRGKTRADHLNQIQKAFTRNARFENKME